MIHILICDDHRIVREGVKQMLADAADMQVMAEAGTGAQALQEVERLLALASLDVVLLDIALPGRDGLDILQTIKERHPKLPVLMLSTYPEKQYAVRCLRLGAAGYLNKSADPDDMLAAVRKVAAGGVFVTPSTAEALAAAVSSKAVGYSGVEGLSHREYQVYNLLTQGRSVSEIGAQLKIAANTVSTYRARILEKTGAKNDVELALYAQRHAKPD
jgi:two-component system, NarL family, invasion response regulator UvrY